MDLKKCATKVVSQEVTYTSSSENFDYSVLATTTGTQVTLQGSAKRKGAANPTPEIESTFNKWDMGQMAVNFNFNVSPEERLELLTNYNEIVATLISQK